MADPDRSLAHGVKRAELGDHDSGHVEVWLVGLGVAEGHAHAVALG
ncbi:MAG: hypothetical protein M3Y74_17485 [Chloroflexota bacterium]|nr:hypothetical protein [Chloroflexota bacterium]